MNRPLDATIGVAAIGLAKTSGGADRIHVGKWNEKMAGFLDEEDYQRERENRRRQKEAADRVTVAIRAAIERLGSAAAARDFMNSCNSLLGGNRPVDVARTTEGLDRVTRLLDRQGERHVASA